MPDTPAEQLALEFGIGLKPVKNAGAQIQQIFESLNKIFAALEQRVAASGKAQEEPLRRVRESAKVALDTAKEQVEQEKKNLTALRAKSQEITNETKLLRQKFEEQKKGTAEEIADLEKLRAKRRERIAEIQEEIAKLKLKHEEERKDRGEHGGLTGGLRYGIGRAIFGQGLAGGVAAGLLAGAGIATLLESAAHAAEHFIEKIKELILHAGRLAELEPQFVALAGGMNNAREYVERLAEASEGLVSRFTLIRLASASLRSTLGLTQKNIEELVRSVTLLASATGRVSPEEAIRNLEGALARGGRGFERIAADLGLTRGQFRIPDTPPGLTPIESERARAQYVIEQIRKQAAGLAEMPKTIEDSLQSLRNSWDALLLEFAKGVNIAPAMQQVLEWANELAARMRALIPTAEEFGKKFGTALAFVIGPLKAVWDILRSLWEVSSAIPIAILEAFGVDKQQAIRLIAQIFGQFGYMARVVAAVVSALAKSLVAIAHMDFGGVTRAFQEMRKELHQIGEDANETYERIRKLGEPPKVTLTLPPGYEIGGKPRFAPGEEKPDPRRERELAELRLKLQREMAQLELQQRKADIARQQQEDNAAYRNGEETLDEHLKKQQQLIVLGMFAQRRQLAIEHETRMAQLREELRRQEDFEYATAESIAQGRAKFALEAQAAQAQYHAKLIETEKTTNRELAQTQEQADRDRRQALLKRLEGEARLEDLSRQGRIEQERRALQMREELVRDEEQRARERFQQGDIGGQEFIAAQVRAVQQAANLRVEAARREFEATQEFLQKEIDLSNQRIKANEKNRVLAQEEANKQTEIRTREAQARVRLEDEVSKEIQTVELQTTRIVRGAVDTIIQGYKQQAEARRGLLELELQYAEQPGGGREQQQRQVLRDIIDELQRQRELWFDILQQQDLALEPRKWLEVAQNITRATLEQEKYNERLREMPDRLAIVGRVFQGFAESIGKIFTSEFARNLAQQIEGAARSLQQLQQRRLALSGAVVRDPAMIQLEREAKAVFAGAQESAGKLATPFDHLTETIRQTVVALEEFRRTLAEIEAQRKEQPPATQTAAQVAQPGAIPLIVRPEQIPPQIRPVLIQQPPSAALQPLAPARDQQVIDSARNFATQIESALHAVQEFIPQSIDRLTRFEVTVTETLNTQAKQLFDDAQESAQALVIPFQALEQKLVEVVLGLDQWKQDLQAAKPSQQPPVARPEIGAPRPTPPQERHPGPFDALIHPKSLEQFVTALSAAVAGLTDFVTSLTHATSTVSGAVGGGLTGLGLGAQIGSAFGPIGTAIGAGVGAAAGALTGGIIGHKNAEVTRNIHTLQEEYRNIMDKFAENTDNLQATITRLSELMLQAQKLQAQSKKGGDKYQQLIDQYIDQIHQLQQQQAKVIQDLDEQLALLSAPREMRQHLGDLEAIIKQYDKFVGAARNVDELRKALDFLNLSVQEWELNLQDQLSQDMEGAINDALRLNDLLDQRQDILDSLADQATRVNQQIYSVLTRGVLTRQPTRAMTAGLEIQQIREQQQKTEEQTAKQMERLNFEIAATSQRVTAEQRVFDLANTRVGLEMQLLKLKAAQTTRDMATIIALQQLLAGGGREYLINILASLFQISNPNVTLPDIMDQLDRLIGGAYQNRASLGFATFRGQNLQ